LVVQARDEFLLLGSQGRRKGTGSLFHVRCLSVTEL
jgi:hypothetical protein